VLPVCREDNGEIISDTMEDQQKIIEETGKRYDDIIFRDDIVPPSVYQYQIDLRNTLIHHTFAGKKFSILLDLGCGTGFHIPALSQYTDNLIGADMSLNAIRQCKKKFDGDFVVCDVRHLPFKDNSIRCIWTAGVLHHVPRDLDTVIGSNISRVLTPGGLFLVDEPNRLNPVNFFVLKFSKADPTGEERALRVSHVIRLLELNDLIIVTTRFYELFSPFGLAGKSHFVFSICKKIDSYLAGCFLSSFLIRWCICAEKKMSR